MNIAFELHDAIRQNRLESTIKYIIEKDKEGINLMDYRGDLPLHLAISKGLISVVHVLLQQGANYRIDVKDGDGYAPLHLAIMRLSLEHENKNTVENLVDVLLRFGADVNLPATPANNTPLHLAAIENDPTIINKLFHNSYGRLGKLNQADPLLKNNEGKVAKDLAQTPEARQILEKEVELCLAKKQEMDLESRESCYAEGYSLGGVIGHHHAETFQRLYRKVRSIHARYYTDAWEVYAVYYQGNNL